MAFSLSTYNDYRILQLELELETYQKLNEVSKKKKGWVRLTGLGIGAGIGTLTVLARIARIIENLIKGLLNILGSPFYHNCSFKKGFVQLLLEAPFNAAVLPFSIAHGGLEIISFTLGVAFNPEPRSAYLYRITRNKLQSLDPNNVLLKLVYPIAI